MISIGKADTNWLVDKDDVRMLVPAVFEGLRTLRHVRDAARTLKRTPMRGRLVKERCTNQVP